MEKECRQKKKDTVGGVDAGPAQMVQQQVQQPQQPVGQIGVQGSQPPPQQVQQPAAIPQPQTMTITVLPGQKIVNGRIVGFVGEDIAIPDSDDEDDFWAFGVAANGDSSGDDSDDDGPLPLVDNSAR